ncbi:hypothetical protein HanRHA438_Chr11g0508431 [Helianthus annuus]|nr:hypothetical protein HanHA300_Chr11g0406631 [Helianthus annuus]KAJ0517848.1 hypothetical protein HanHA89_Chr11g0430381 [Helianthus annuus]KAJ0685864.1 hypothetical protein HanLR1_Chr11g0407871 [Helianthus annuus]KAJ0871110.1 hypothetical protein HanRHA438_Chr11g0508431 [Helianthus annuus]
MSPHILMSLQNINDLFIDAYIPVLILGFSNVFKIQLMITHKYMKLRTLVTFFKLYLSKRTR